MFEDLLEPFKFYLILPHTAILKVIGMCVIFALELSHFYFLVLDENRTKTLRPFYVCL